jgi:hypothetical protein
LLTDAVHETVALKSPRVALGEVGASGALAGVYAADADDATESPMPLVAFTVNVYAVPLVRPVTMQLNGFGDTGVVEHVAPPGLAVTVYAVNGVPLAELAAHETVT